MKPTRRGSTAIASALAGLGLVVCAGPAGGAVAPACAARDLSGVFAVVPGSAGAGNIVYKLRLRNTATRACFVTGIPGLRLLDAHGHALPTHPVPAHPRALTAVRVVLAPGRAAAETARFSPDVPGVGEQTIGQCEPTAHRLRVTPQGGGSLRAPIRPPTAVCEHGTMTLSVLTAA